MKNKFYQFKSLNFNTSYKFIYTPRHYGIRKALEMKSQTNDKEPIKFAREYTNIKHMYLELKKYSFKNPTTLASLNDKEQIELIYILNSMIASCRELKRLYHVD